MVRYTSHKRGPGIYMKLHTGIKKLKICGGVKTMTMRRHQGEVTYTGTLMAIFLDICDSMICVFKAKSKTQTCGENHVRLGFSERVISKPLPSTFGNTVHSLDKVQLPWCHRKGLERSYPISRWGRTHCDVLHICI